MGSTATPGTTSPTSRSSRVRGQRRLHRPSEVRERESPGDSSQKISYPCSRVEGWHDTRFHYENTLALQAFASGAALAHYLPHGRTALFRYRAIFHFPPESLPCKGIQFLEQLRQS